MTREIQTSCGPKRASALYNKADRAPTWDAERRAVSRDQGLCPLGCIMYYQWCVRVCVCTRARVNAMKTKQESFHLSKGSDAGRTR
eukprot:1160626-Pelagomonas_calceolata.AAC.12